MAVHPGCVCVGYCALCAVHLCSEHWGKYDAQHSCLLYWAVDREGAEMGELGVGLVGNLILEPRCCCMSARFELCTHSVAPHWSVSCAGVSRQR